MACRYCGSETEIHRQSPILCDQAEARDPEASPARLLALSRVSTAARFVRENPALQLLALEDPDLYDEIQGFLALYAREG